MHRDMNNEQREPALPSLTRVDTGMVAGGEGDHETVLLLHQSVHRDALRGEAAGRQHGGVRVQRVPPRALGVLRNVLSHSSFKLVQRAGRHAVANLRAADV